MAMVRLYSAQSNVRRSWTPEFTAKDDNAAERKAMKMLNCKADEVVLLFEDVDHWSNPLRVNQARKVGPQNF